ncbi:MAG: O-antigen ligase family protein [Pseudomonadota bacterium]
MITKPAPQSRYHRAVDRSSLIAATLALGLLAALFGAAVPLLGWLVPLVAIMAGFSLWVLLDFRAGVAFAIVLMPLSALTFFPHEMFGVRGLNPLNVILMLTMLSYIVHAGLRRWHDPLVPVRLLTWYVLPIAIAAVVGMSSVGLIPARFAADKLILFNDGIGYLRDAFFKPQFLVLLSLLVALAVRHSQKPERFLYLMLVSGWVFCTLVAWLLLASGMSLRELASPLARTFLGRLGMHANEMSLLLNMLYALTLFSIRGLRAGMARNMLFISAVVFGLAVLMTFSRGGFLGFFLINLIYFWKRLSVKTVIVGLIVTACVGPFVFDALLERAMTGVAGGDRGAVTAGRLDGIWLPLLPYVLAEPVLPHGIYSILWSTPVRLNKMLPVAQPHSAWLGSLMDLGLIGFGFVLAFLLLVRREFLRLSRTQVAPTLQGMFAGGALLVPLWFVQGLTDDRFTPTFSQSYFWIALGVLIGCGGLYRDTLRSSPASAEDAQARPNKSRLAKPWVHDPREDERKKAVKS